MVSVVLSRGSFSNTMGVVRQYICTRGRLIEARLLTAFLSKIELLQLIFGHALPGGLHHDALLYPLYGRCMCEKDDEDGARAYSVASTYKYNAARMLEELWPLLQKCNP